MMVGERKVGKIKNEEFKIYECHRNFYSHQYNYTQAYYWETALINILKKENVKFIRLVEHYKNERSNIDEKRTFEFPIIILERIKLEKIHHKTKGFGEQTGILREVLKTFEVNK